MIYRIFTKLNRYVLPSDCFHSELLVPWMNENIKFYTLSDID